jgi:hypothetical protein
MVIPEGVPSGNSPLMLRVGTVISKVVSIPIQQWNLQFIHETVS